MKKESLSTLLSALIMVGCDGRPAATPSPGASPATGAASPAALGSPGPAAVTTHAIRGKVEAIAPDRRTITLDHEAVADLMPAMKMEYKVQDPVLLQGLAVGDRVQGHFEARPGGEYVITHLAK